MAETSWFFDGSTGTEGQFLEFMGYMMKRNGFLSGVLNGLAPTQSTPAAMTVAIASGVAWVNGSVYKNSASLAMTIETAHVTYPRIDRIVIRHSPSANSNILAVLKGTAAASPTAPALTQTAATWEIAVCDVAVAANATSILTANITDYRTNTLGGLAACNIGAAYIEPNGDLNMASKQIKAVADPTSAQYAATKNYVDTYFAPKASPTFTGTPLAPTAATSTSTTQIATTAFVKANFGAWANWTPTLTWGGATPSFITTQARYMQLGKTVYFQIYSTWIASGTTTSLSITNLPGTLVTTMSRVRVSGYGVYELSGSHYYDPIAYIETSVPNVAFWVFVKNTTSGVGAINLNGFYEVSS